jgi:hypothetical protein
LRRSIQLIVLLAALVAALAGGAAYTAHASSAPGHDGDIWWDGLGHDSRSAIYRLPGGAVTTGTKVKLRFRTFHDDATSVALRAYYTTPGAEKLVDMTRVASNVPCYQQLAFGCDFWEATIDAGDPGTIYYRFIVKDGQKTVFYEDDSEVRDGGWGKPFDASPDWGWAITVYDPNFKPVPWMQNGVIYQIFPDRFRRAATRRSTSGARTSATPIRTATQRGNRRPRSTGSCGCRGARSPRATAATTSMRCRAARSAFLRTRPRAPRGRTGATTTAVTSPGSRRSSSI